jgi:class 3 adenylate cyclase
VVVELNRDRQILAYRSDDRLVLGNDAFKLRMGFGLHAGWAIEGAVGSLQKVDATYLSPHVNMTARMEAASKQFGVPILMTETFHEVSNRINTHLYITKIESLSHVLTLLSILPSRHSVIVSGSSRVLPKA